MLCLASFHFLACAAKTCLAENNNKTHVLHVLANYGQKIKKTYDFGQFSQKHTKIFTSTSSTSSNSSTSTSISTSSTCTLPQDRSRNWDVWLLCTILHVLPSRNTNNVERHVHVFITNPTGNQYRYLQVNNVI